MGEYVGVVSVMARMSPLQLAHQILVELIFRLAGLLLPEGQTFIVFERHATIVSQGRRSNREGWPPLWMALGRSFGLECFDGAKVRGGVRQRSLPARAETRDLGAGLGHPAYAGG